MFQDARPADLLGLFGRHDAGQTWPQASGLAQGESAKGGALRGALAERRLIGARVAEESKEAVEDYATYCKRKQENTRGSFEATI